MIPEITERECFELVVGQRGLIPDWGKTSKLKYATHNCRSEEAAVKLWPETAMSDPAVNDSLVREQKRLAMVKPWNDAYSAYRRSK